VAFMGMESVDWHFHNLCRITHMQLL